MVSRRDSCKNLLGLLILLVAPEVLLNAVEAGEELPTLFPLKKPMDFGKGLLVGGAKPLLFGERKFTIRLFGDEKHMLFDRTLYPDEKPGIQTLVNILNPDGSQLTSEGVFEFRRCNFGAAYQIFRQVMENKSSDIAYVNCSAVRHLLGDNDGAVLDATAAIDINSSNAYAYVNRASIKYYSGDKLGAVEDLRNSIELSSQQNKSIWQAASYLSKLESE